MHIYMISAKIILAQYKKYKATVNHDENLDL